MKHSYRTIRNGYTLAELLIVVTILGLAAAVVVPKMLEPGTMQIQAAGRMIMSDIQIAQNDAMAKQEVRRVVFDSSLDSYRVTNSAGTTISVPWKGGVSNNYTVDFNGDSRFSSVSIEDVDFGGGSATLEFDESGAPVNSGSVDVVFKTTRYRITVAPFTGRITIDEMN